MRSETTAVMDPELLADLAEATRPSGSPPSPWVLWTVTVLVALVAAASGIAVLPARAARPTVIAAPVPSPTPRVEVEVAPGTLDALKEMGK